MFAARTAVAPRLRVGALALGISLLMVGAPAAHAQPGPGGGPGGAPGGGPGSRGGATGCSLQIVLENPGPNDLLLPGGFEIEGRVVDTSAAQGPSADRVQVFFGDRDAGAPIIGEVSLSPTGAANRGPGEEEEHEFLAPNGEFHVLVDVPEELGAHSLFAYAHSPASGREAIVQVPVMISGQDTDDADSDTASSSGEAAALQQTCT